MSIKEQIESIIFLGGDENKVKDLAKFFSISIEDTLKIIKELKDDRKNTGINVELDNDIVYLVTNPLNGDIINKFFDQETKPKKLSTASMETLSIVAYKQPVSKSEIEHIRGVSVDRIIQNLEEKKLVRVCGKKEGQGRAKLYEVTKKFLDYLGIDDIKDLPNYAYVKEKLEYNEMNLINKQTLTENDEIEKIEEINQE